MENVIVDFLNKELGMVGHPNLYIPLTENQYYHMKGWLDTNKESYGDFNPYIEFFDHCDATLKLFRESQIFRVIIFEESEAYERAIAYKTGVFGC